MKRNEEITVTRERIAHVTADIISGDRIKPLIEKAPILMLAFTVFSAELMRTLFDTEDAK